MLFSRCLPPPLARQLTNESKRWRNAGILAALFQIGSCALALFLYGWRRLVTVLIVNVLFIIVSSVGLVGFIKWLFWVIAFYTASVWGLLVVFFGYALLWAFMSGDWLIFAVHSPIVTDVAIAIVVFLCFLHMAKERETPPQEPAQQEDRTTDQEAPTPLPSAPPAPVVLDVGPLPQPATSSDSIGSRDRLPEGAPGCPICLMRRPDVCLVPCGHMVCGRCADQLMVCAICRGGIQSRVKTYSV
ncbi:unnamed protein product [Vitrella brassicaformis CCMP3155]|uniref:RING-type domain-containing protein n=2 Tax=Vitrella brassicaformis TaxID=1169539 RepID=A0A0G4EVE1_VITBC|nr:unnamed protein product [Vitrella brassicaformis CCMP3155]|eukprot:CEM02591.1 unnamed protein product [Vitrella brassicaformis CCMP3155]